MADVVDAAGREVVEDEDLVAPRQVGIREMRPDEPRPARDQHAHQIAVPNKLPLPEWLPRNHRRSLAQAARWTGL